MKLVYLHDLCSRPDPLWKYEAVVVEGSQRLVVPFDPRAASGELVQVKWRPPGVCNTMAASAYSSKGVQLSVEPPQAKGMLLSVRHKFIVVTGDLAAQLGADFPTTDQIAVSLVFPDGTVKANLQTDPRTTFEVAAGAPFSVNANGVVTANAGGVVRVGSVAVKFDGQNVTQVVMRQVNHVLTV